jgi:hypothetical protein
MDLPGLKFAHVSESHVPGQLAAYRGCEDDGVVQQQLMSDRLAQEGASRGVQGLDAATLQPPLSCAAEQLNRRQAEADVSDLPALESISSPRD